MKKKKKKIRKKMMMMKIRKKKKKKNKEKLELLSIILFHGELTSVHGWDYQSRLSDMWSSYYFLFFTFFYFLKLFKQKNQIIALETRVLFLEVLYLVLILVYIY
jgi:hypothetical protein